MEKRKDTKNFEKKNVEEKVLNEFKVMIVSLH